MDVTDRVLSLPHFDTYRVSLNDIYGTFELMVESCLSVRELSSHRGTIER